LKFFEPFVKNLSLIDKGAKYRRTFKILIEITAAPIFDAQNKFYEYGFYD